MTQLEFTLGYLNAVQKKHKKYFAEKRSNIMKCVNIKGERLVSVFITDDELPVEIQHDIELMFWQG
jgi:hypothetical protein